MARRLFVVLSQSPTSNAARRQVEEELVTHLLMESGIEMNVVPHLADLPTDATGMLCLEGISGNMVLASWLTDREAWTHLDRYGIQGRQGVTQLADPDEVPGDQEETARRSTGSRAIYLLNLNHHAAVESLLAEIRRIRDDRAVQTFQLGGLGTNPLPLASSPPRNEPPPNVPARTAPAPPASPPSAMPRADSPPPSGSSPSTATPPTSTAKPLNPPSPLSLPPSSSPAPEREFDWEREEARREAEAERLVDQLDELDI